MELKGLNEQQMLESRMNFGSNKLPEKPLKKWYEFFLETFQDRLNLILLGMMIVFALLAIFGKGSISEPIGVGCVLVAIATINVITGMKSQKRTKELRDKTSIRYCNVIRDGEVKEINTNDLVVGDVVILQSGEGIYADGYLIEGHLKVDNSALNGESDPCKKTAIDNAPYDAKTREPSGDDYVDQHSLFAGALVVEGEGKMIVTNVGIGTDQYPGTVNGKTITSIDEIEQQKTSLEIQLDDLAGQISKFGYVGASIIIAVLLGSKVLELGGFAEFFDLGALNIFQEILTAVVTALTIIVAAVPEGLPLIISLITAQNARVMIKNNVLAKNTNKIPEAGNIQLLCTDKTGTLTGGKLVPVYVINGNGDIIDKNDYQNYFIAENVVLNSSCIRNNPDEYIGGNITDRALSSLASFDSYNSIKKEYKLVDKKEFNSAWKYSAVAVDNGIEGKLEIVRTFYKGAPEIIINKCSTYIADDSYSQVPLDKEKILAEIKKYTKQAMRVIALAYVPRNTIGDEIPDGLTLSALVAIRDDVRPEVPEAVRKVQEAGVQVMMITGDVIDTAVAIATDCGIYKPDTDDLAFTAKELDNLDDEMVKGILKHIKVIARATPMTKLRIVKLAQELGTCCAMTGKYIAPCYSNVA